MARPHKGQHKIPRIYLEAFTDPEDYVWVADRNLKLYKRSPKETLIEKDYFTIRFDTGGGTLKVETEFLGGIETFYSKIYRDVLEKQATVSTETKAKLSIFVASMLERQPSMRRSLENFFSDLKEKIEHLKNLPDSAKKKSASLPIASGGGPTFTADELLKAGEDVGSLHSSMIPDTVIKIAPIIFDMKWAFIIKPRSSDPFITSDNPCIMVDPVATHHMNVIRTHQERIIKLILNCKSMKPNQTSMQQR